MPPPIHPESYSVAQTIVDQVDADPAELFSTPALGDRAPTSAPAKPSESPVAAPQDAPAPETVVAKPTANEPVATEPVATEPAVTEPAVTEPVATEPAATEPVVAESATAEPSAPSVTPAVASPAEEIDAAEFAKAAEKRKQILEKVATIDLDQLEQQTSVGKKCC